MQSIMLAENNKIQKYELRIALRNEGFDVLLPINGAEAIEWAIKKKPDIIVSEMDVPGINGLNILETLNNLNIRIPFIFLTTEIEIAKITESFDLGAMDYFIKPVEIQELIEVIKSLLKN